MTIFWSYILDRFNATSKHPQYTDIEIWIMSSSYKTRNDFDRFERGAKELSGLENYDTAIVRCRRRPLFDVHQQGQTELNARDKSV